jgi:hypothetical protein
MPNAPRYDGCHEACSVHRAGPTCTTRSPTIQRILSWLYANLRPQKISGLQTVGSPEMVLAIDSLRCLVTIEVHVESGLYAHIVRDFSAILLYIQALVLAVNTNFLPVILIVVRAPSSGETRQAHRCQWCQFPERYQLTAGRSR